MAKKRLFLVDGMSNMYRAFFAIRGLRTSSGLPTNAIYGFIRMLRKVLTDEKPDYIGVAIDLGGPTVRHEQFAAYKATRRPMPEELSLQVPYILNVCTAFRVPVLSHLGYEADDVIGTLSRKAVEAGLQAVIVTIDKDMYQLVCEDIVVLDTRDSYTWMDATKVEEKVGLPPERIVDWLSLKGDSIDNVPGAPGIGEKGARDLIQEFGSVDNLLAHVDQVSRKTYRESLQQHMEQVRRSKELVTIYTDLPVDLDLDQLKSREPDARAARELFTELEFHSLVREFTPPLEQLVAAPEFASGKELEELYRSCVERGRLVLHILGSHPEPLRGAPLCASIMLDEHPRSVDLAIAEGEKFLRQVLENPRLEKTVHDFKTVRLLFREANISYQGPVKDIMLAAYLANPIVGDYSLDRLALDQLNYQLPAPPSEPLSKADWEQPLRREPIASLGAQRAYVVQNLHEKLFQQMTDMDLEPLYSTMEFPLVEVLATMEQSGVRVDLEALRAMSRELEGELERLTRQIYELAGTEFNINSPKQLGEVLFERLSLPVLKKTRKLKSFATDVEVLEQLAEIHELPKLLLEYRQLSKLKSGYIDALPSLVNPATGRVHTSYNQTVTATGRLSSSNPNLQNIPIRSELGKEIRAAFVAEPGQLLMAADYSQIELRIMAHLSQDPALIEAFRSQEDIHARTAREVFGMAALMNPEEFRRRAKVINFGIMYGLSPFGLAKELKIEASEAKLFIENYFKRYSGVKSWLDRTIETTRSAGLVRTLFGRVRPIPEIHSRDSNVRHFAERTAINTPIQGTAADLIKLAMVNLHGRMRRQNLQSRMILQVHDELVFEVPVPEVETMREIVREEMEGVYDLRVPLVADVSQGPNWRDAK